MAAPDQNHPVFPPPTSKGYAISPAQFRANRGIALRLELSTISEVVMARNDGA